MEITDAMSKSVNSAQLAIFNDEVEAGNNLRDRAHVAFDEMFSQGKDREESIKEHLELLGELKSFEDELSTFAIMNFLYAIVARCALNSLKFDDAVMYAQAGIEANKKHNDQEGVKVNAEVLLDTACFAGGFIEAQSILKNYPELVRPGLIELIDEQASKRGVNDDFKKLLNLSKRPSSLKFVLDETLARDESILRSLMKVMGISRKEALSYKKMAYEMMEKDYFK